MKNNTTMAIEHFNSYPHFVANQVLRCSDLNNSFGFLDEQARLSRLHLVGQGILSGLEMTLQQDRLRIGKGFALDSGGWVVQLTEDTEYPFVAAVPYSETPFESDNLEDLVVHGGSRVKYICFKTEDDARELGLVPSRISTISASSLIVAVVYGTRRELSNRCSHDSCDINVTSLLTEAWPVLVNPGLGPLYQKLAPYKSHLIPRVPCYLLTWSKSLRDFNRLIKSKFKSDRNDLVADLKSILRLFGQKYVPWQKKMKGFSTTATAWDGVFPDSRRLFGRLHGCILKIEKYNLSDKEDYVRDYYLAFFNDILSAVSEFIDAYNVFVSETIRIPKWIPEGRLTYLGKASSGNDEEYRSYFRKADNAAFEAGALKLGRMLRRICVLSEHFIGSPDAPQMAKMMMNLAAVKPGARLSEKPIPFYYERTQTPEFLENWNAETGITYRNQIDYENPTSKYLLSDVPLLPQFGNYLYLEAYQYKSVDVVKNCLAPNQCFRWLNLTVKTVELRAVRPLSPVQKTFLDQYFAVDAFKKTYYPQLSEQLTGNAKFLANVLNQHWCYRQNRIATIVSDIQAYRDGYNVCWSFTADYVKKIQDSLDGLWEMCQAFQKIIGMQYYGLKKNKYSDPIYSAFLALFHCYIDASQLDADLKNAVLCGPVYPNSTVYLLTENNKVITYAVSY